MLLLIGVILLGLFMCDLTAYRKQKRHSPHKPLDKEGGDYFSITSFDGGVVYDDILKATNNFDEAYSIGTGGYALTNIRHRNIVKLCGYCSHARHSFLIYEYLEKGSLGSILCNEILAKELDWLKRVSIVKVVANGLAYMHHDCTPPIIHRDVWIANILLDFDYEY
ncbi:unnamed protein product [Lactuca saligna]|uniref:non-specific serine/threonine protein kinase n=1 Tax=Lactuca saligna TaxID=75948 RepID=A0AA35YLK2_LACSI|nr:unnamed protein product [Lactuca saligna]